MIAKELITKALNLLGYNDEQGNTNSSRFQIASKYALNAVYADLFFCANDEGFKEMSLSDEIELPERIIHNVMPYGVAAFIAENLGDGEKQQYFMSIYNRKRAQLSRIENIKTDIPTPKF